MIIFKSQQDISLFILACYCQLLQLWQLIIYVNHSILLCLIFGGIVNYSIIYYVFPLEKQLGFEFWGITLFNNITNGFT